LTSQGVLERIRERGIRDDLDALYYSRHFNESLKAGHEHFRHLGTIVAKVDNGFYITPKLEIAVARLSKVKKRVGNAGGDTPNILRMVYEGGVIHEDLHAAVFPVMARAKEVYAPLVQYLAGRGVPVNPSLLNEVENVVSDIINEVVAVEHGLDGGRLPLLRYHYIAKWQEKPGKPREQVEAEWPLKALFDTHNEAFTDTYLGRQWVPKGYRSDYVYSLIREFAKDFDLRGHVEKAGVGGFTEDVLKKLVESYSLYKIMDLVYDWYKSTGAVLSDWDKERLRRIFNAYLLPREYRLYALYYALVATMYRLEVEAGREGGRGLEDLRRECPAVDWRAGLPVPPPGEADEIMRRILAGLLLLDPETLDKVADNLLSSIITVRGTRLVAKGRVGEVTVPFYRNPRGRIDPLSLVRSRRKPRFLDWEVYEEVEYMRFEREPAEGSPPDHFTAVIDISGSTMSPSAVLAPVVGTETTVFDVERAIVISLMKLARKYGGERVAATVHLFNHNVETRSGPVGEMIDFLLGRRGQIVPDGFTDIVKAVRAGTASHRDRPDNPFILVTDLAISWEEEQEVYKTLKSGLKRSPILVVVIGGDIGVLRELNRERFSAAVSVKTLWDLRKLEAAMQKVSSAITS